MHARQLRCERVLANADSVLMMLRVAGWGGCVWGCSEWWGLGGADRGAAMRAGNDIGDDGTASLAPSLGRMAQLTSLDLSGTLRAIGWACAVRGCLRAPAMWLDDLVCCGPRRLRAGL